MLTTTALAILAAPAVAVPQAQAAWSKPFEFTKPGTLDLIGSQLAFAPNGASAAAYGVEDVDTPGDSQGYVVSRSAPGTVGTPQAIGSAKRVLALSFDGSALELLTGISPSALSCCSGVQAVRLTARGSLQRPRTLIGGLAGHTEAQLLTLGNGGMLATIATERGVWVLQSARGDRFGTQHRLSKSNQIPQSVSAAWLGGASTIVAWTSARGPAGTANPRTIYYAFGSRRGAPRRVQSLVTVPPTHRLDELQVARHRSGATAVWVESWYDRRGKFHSEVRAANISPHPGIRKLSAPGQPAAGISIAADAAGDQGVIWKSCRANGSCIAYAAVRGARASFSSGRTFGQLDASDDPALAIGPQGQAIVAWVRSGRPMAAVGSARNRRFGAARSLSNTAQFAAELTLAYGPRRQALAAWSQGTLNPSVVGAAYTGQ